MKIDIVKQFLIMVKVADREIMVKVIQETHYRILLYKIIFGHYFISCHAVMAFNFPSRA